MHFWPQTACWRITFSDLEKVDDAWERADGFRFRSTRRLRTLLSAPPNEHPS